MTTNNAWHRITPGGFVTYPREMGLCASLSVLLQQPEINQVPTAIITDPSNVTTLNALLGEELPPDMFKSYGTCEDQELTATLLSDECGIVIFDSAALVYDLNLVPLILRSTCKVFIMVGWSDCRIMPSLAATLSKYRSYCLRPPSLRPTILSYFDQRVDQLPLISSEQEYCPSRSVGAYLARGEELLRWPQLGILPDLCTYDYVCDWIEGLCRHKDTESLKIKFYNRTEDEYLLNRKIMEELDYAERVYQALHQRSTVIG